MRSITFLSKLTYSTLSSGKSKNLLVSKFCEGIGRGYSNRNKNHEDKNSNNRLRAVNALHIDAVLLQPTNGYLPSLNSAEDREPFAFTEAVGLLLWI